MRNDTSAHVNVERVLNWRIILSFFFFEQLAKLQSTNRAASESAEKEFESTTQEIKPGTEWERVAKLCDFNPKSARNLKDISRLRCRNTFAWRKRM